MDDLREQYQKNYINLLAKLGENELIINIHKSKKDEILEQVTKMREILANGYILTSGSKKVEESE